MGGEIGVSGATVQCSQWVTGSVDCVWSPDLWTQGIIVVTAITVHDGDSGESQGYLSVS